MGMWGFIVYFIASLVGGIFLMDFAPNKFISGFIFALIIALLASRSST